MLVIGLAGGIASGKSLVAECFQDLGAALLDADRVGHQVLSLSRVIQEIEEAWGESVLSDGRVNRSTLAAIVFGEGNGDQLERLEQITHPRIKAILSEELEVLRAKSDVPAVLLDAPVMFKAGWDKFCDKIVFVEATYKVRQDRALLRGWDENELAQRESRQTSLDEKRKRSTDLINNSGSIESTRQQVLEFWRAWGLESS